MGKVELRANILKMLNETESEHLLQTVYDFLKLRESNNVNRAWDTLSESQKKEVLLAFDESEDDQNLIERKDFLH